MIGFPARALLVPVAGSDSTDVPGVAMFHRPAARRRPGLAKAIAASFVGLELYEGVDLEGSAHALDALDQFAALIGVLDELGPVLQRAVRSRLRRTQKRPMAISPQRRNVIQDNSKEPGG